jgi:hypothetical protein
MSNTRVICCLMVAVTSAVTSALGQEPSRENGQQSSQHRRDSVTTTGAASMLSGPQDWRTYADKRSGTRVEYPAKLFSVEGGAPVRGEGKRFQTRDSAAELHVYSLANNEHDTPQGYLDRYLMKDRLKLGYVRVTSRFLVVSGTSRGRIVYSRCNFVPAPRGRMHCIYMEYPQTELRAFDPIVTRISKSLGAEGGSSENSAGNTGPR